MTQSERDGHYHSKAEVLQTLARLGNSQEIIAEIAAQTWQGSNFCATTVRG